MPAVIPPRRVLEGRGIRLVPLTPHDLPELFAAIGTAEVFAGGYGGGPAGLPATENGFVEFGKRYYAWEAGNVYGVRLLDGELVGTSTLAEFDEPREHAHLGWTAYAPRVWGTAVNPETKLLMLGEAFDAGFGRVKLQAEVLLQRRTPRRWASLVGGSTACRPPLRQPGRVLEGRSSTSGARYARG